MKRALLLPLLLLASVLWGVNWKLDHPPLTAPDQEFTRLIRGADEVEISSCLGHKKAVLRGELLHTLIESIHLRNDFAPQYSSCDSCYTLSFKRKNRELSRFDVDFDAMGLDRTSFGRYPFNPGLEQRTGAKLERDVSDLMKRAPVSP